MLSHRSLFDNMFVMEAAPPLPQCATLGCDRRPARGSRWCPCCIQDRVEGRTVIKRAADEILPFTVEMERKSSSGPCPTMSKGDCGVREVRRNRKNGKYRRDKFAHPAGAPRRIDPPRAGKRTGISFAPVN